MSIRDSGARENGASIHIASSRAGTRRFTQEIAGASPRYSRAPGHHGGPLARLPGKKGASLSKNQAPEPGGVSKREEALKKKGIANRRSLACALNVIPPRRRKSRRLSGRRRVIGQRSAHIEARRFRRGSPFVTLFRFDASISVAAPRTRLGCLSRAQDCALFKFDLYHKL